MLPTERVSTLKAFWEWSSHLEYTNSTPYLEDMVKRKTRFRVKGGGFKRLGWGWRTKWTRTRKIRWERGLSHILGRTITCRVRGFSK